MWGTTSVVIAAHNEADVIGRCLEALAAEAAAGRLDVTVVANGCTDGTAARSRRFSWVRVVELEQASKSAALNAGDRVARGFPRIYLDADVVMTGSDLLTLSRALDPGSGVLQAVVPRRRLDTRGSPLPVRAYYAIHSRLPALQNGLFGRGAIAVSESGRSRFGSFPDMTADDLFLDSLFTSDEKEQVDAVTSTIAVPRRTSDLIRRLVRVRRGNAELRSASPRGAGQGDVRGAARFSWFVDVVLPRPWLAPAAACYVAITSVAAMKARRPSRSGETWLRDSSSRQPTDGPATAERVDG